MTDLELAQSSVDRSIKQIAYYQGLLEAYQRKLGIPDKIFDDLKWSIKQLQFWADQMKFWENEVCEELRLEAVYPPPTGE